MSRTRSRVIMLARFPRAGEVKTRLAASIGDEAARKLYERLVRHTMRVMLALQAGGEARAEIRTDAAFQGAAREWLAARTPRRRRPAFRYQGEGDLGTKLRFAFIEAFRRRDQRVVVVGADCARLQARHLREALAALERADIVLGPATDGGYWLIGMHRRVAERALGPLFRDIPWGTPEVFVQTMHAAEKAGLIVASLEELPDVDVEADLPDALAALSSDVVGAESRISVIIPALDDAEALPAAIESARAGGASEVIVVDGGSRDGTPEVARARGARVVDAARGRAAQMNAGAAAATGDVLCFLHADTVLPDGFATAVRKALAAPEAVACGFDFAVPAEARHAWLISTLGQLRWRATRLPYGDQCLCVPRSVFDALDGFAELPTMEDWELGWRLRRLGRIERVPLAAITSARAWEAHGLVVPSFVNLAVIIGFRLGVDPARLTRWRQRVARSAG